MDKNHEAIKANITAKIKELKADGTVGMSLANLRQITPTRGVSCSIPMYPGLFAAAAAECAKELRFPIR